MLGRPLCRERGVLLRERWSFLSGWVDVAREGLDHVEELLAQRMGPVYAFKVMEYELKVI